MNRHHYSFARPYSLFRCCAGILIGVLLIMGLTACSDTWEQMWSRETTEGHDKDDPLLNWNGRETASDGSEVETYPFDVTQVHEGTNILYSGPAASPNSRYCVVIDAGHQGKGNTDKEPEGPGSETLKNKVSSGTQGVSTNIPEHELNLAVALKLRNELCRRGYTVVMIRETAAVDISNMERAEIANGYMDDYDRVILFRIHANGSSTDPNAHGALMVCHSKYNPYPTCAAHYDESYLLSDVVLKAYCASTGLEAYKTSILKQDNMSGTNWSQVPTTILEMGFMTNAAEDVLMSYEPFRDNAAVGIADGIDAYFEEVDHIVKFNPSDATDALTNPEK